MADWTYKDIDLSLKRHPLSGDIVVVTDEAAVRAAVRNLVMLAPFNKPFNPEIASPLYGLLFEPIDQVTAILIQNDLQFLIQTYEPRLQNLAISVVPLPEDNKYEVNIRYRIRKTLNEQTLQLFIPVERLR